MILRKRKNVDKKEVVQEILAMIVVDK
jgi:hypothetical protein